MPVSRLFSAAFVAIILAASALPLAGSADDPVLDAAIARVKPALVRLEVVTSDFEHGREIKRLSSGSGTIITADGHVLTNHHVAGRSRRITSTLADKEEIPATLVATDPLTDISVVKLQAPGRTFPTASFGSSALPVFNQFVAGLPIGKPVEAVVLRDGKEERVTFSTELRPPADAQRRAIRELGVVVSDVTAARARLLGRDKEGGVLVHSVRPGGPAADAEPKLATNDVIIAVADAPVTSIVDLERLLQKPSTDDRNRKAAANEDVRASSATIADGPLAIRFERGRAEYLTVLARRSAAADDLGAEARKAWIPVATQTVGRKLASVIGLGTRPGLRVTRVYDVEGTRTDLKVGDVVLAVDGDRVSARLPPGEDGLRVMVRQRAIGSSVTLAILRSAQEMTVTAVLGTEPEVAREMPRYRDEAFEFVARASPSKIGRAARGSRRAPSSRK